MKNYLLNRNLLFLKKKAPHLYERISTLKPSKTYAVITSKSGSPSLVYIDEAGNKNHLTYNELYKEVARLSNAMWNIGIRKNDIRIKRII